MRGAEKVEEKRFYLGNDIEHIVYEAEVVEVILAVKLLKEVGGKDTMALGVNNQAAIRATNTFHSQLGHYLVNAFHNGRKLTIRWTPGHKGITGNEATNIQAKKAVGGESTEGASLPRSL
ncbi:hypothetical protein BDR06DRAFT_881962 [Suillus hirtellus]|nr:hypothetical protein BDR06DRAFT_881962 [Suillus hirtellus]